SPSPEMSCEPGAFTLESGTGISLPLQSATLAENEVTGLPGLNTSAARGCSLPCMMRRLSPSLWPLAERFISFSAQSFVSQHHAPRYETNSLRRFWRRPQPLAPSPRPAPTSEASARVGARDATTDARRGA